MSDCGTCGRTADDLVTHACKQADCPLRDRRRTSLRQLVTYLGVSAGMVGTTYALLAGGLNHTIEPTAAAQTAQAAPAAPPAPRPVVTPVSDRTPRPALATPRPVPVALVGGADRAQVLRDREARRESFARIDPSLIHPSFDCGATRSTSLRTVCSDPELAILDRNTALMFNEALARSADPRALRRRRAQWAAGLAHLPGDRDTLLDYYEGWAAELNGVAPARS